MKIIITGPKGVGKTTIGKKIAKLLDVPFYDTDEEIENIFNSEKPTHLKCRDIYKIDKIHFRELEEQAVCNLAQKNYCIISTGGSTILNPKSRNILRNNSIIVFLDAEDNLLWGRMQLKGLPQFFETTDGRQKHEEKNEQLRNTVKPIADICIQIEKDKESGIHRKIAENICEYLAARSSNPNTIGEILRVTTFGESHGEAVGAVIDGVKSGIELNEEDIQVELNKRKPAQSIISSERNEKDEVKILSGIFEGKTTGAPICLMIENTNQNSQVYEKFKNTFRPGHADFTFWKKFGLRDYRGGGRASGRETVARTAAGAVAKKILSEEFGVSIIAFAEEIAGIRGYIEDLSFIEKNAVRAADTQKWEQMLDAVLKAKSEGDSVGGIVKLIVKNLSAGIGDPVFGKLDSKLAAAIMSIGSVKGIEFGEGFLSTRLTGKENNDEMADGKFLSNHCGGILGGISNGEDIVMRIAVKPTPSILKKQHTISENGENTDISVAGQHDACIVPRIIPVIESMAALTILECININEALGR